MEGDVSSSSSSEACFSSLGCVDQAFWHTATVTLAVRSTGGYSLKVRSRGIRPRYQILPILLVGAIIVVLSSTHPQFVTRPPHWVTSRKDAPPHLQRNRHRPLGVATIRWITTCTVFKKLPDR